MFKLLVFLMFGEKNYLGLLVPKNTLDDEMAGNIQNLVKKLSSALEKCKKEKNIRFGWLNQIQIGRAHV